MALLKKVTSWLEANLVTALAGLVLLLFAGVWIWLSIKLLTFTASTAHPTLTFSTAQVTVGGFLASAVGAGTASVLGFEIQQVSAAPGAMVARPNVAAQVNQAVTGSPVLLLGILTYAGVGIIVLVSWLIDSSGAPDVISSFGLGVLGWLAGAFGAVFRKSS